MMRYPDEERLHRREIPKRRIKLTASPLETGTECVLCSHVKEQIRVQFNGTHLMAVCSECLVEDE